MPNMYSYVHDLNTWVDPFGLAGVKTMNAKVIQFSQNSVSSTFSDGTGKLSGLTNAMKSNPNYYKNVKEIKVIKFKNLPQSVQNKLLSQGASKHGIYSIDNRRLLAARRAGSKIKMKFIKPSDVPDINLDKRFSTTNGSKTPKCR